MANLDLMSESIRRELIKKINGQENKNRKAESLKRFEVFSERQDRYIIEKLESEFSSKTVADMRKILSINLCPRIINQMASIYNDHPDRDFSSVTEEQEKSLELIYSDAKADAKLLTANKYFKLNDQVCLQFVFKDGKPKLKVLLPHQYDVVPDVEDPEKAFCYIVSVFDKYEYLSSSSSKDLANPKGGFSLKSQETLDGINQPIADSEDYKASLDRYEVWSNDFNFIMDGRGKIISGDEVENPISMLPFVDVSIEKDGEFFIRRGNGIVQFAIDFGSQLSDVSNIIRLQGYAQAIVYAEKQPQNMIVGPNHILFMELDPNRPELKPSFEFVNPGSDLKSALDFLEMTLRLFLTSKGIDPKTISASGEGQSFTSGLERLLSMVDKFEASRSDLELFRCAEYELNKIMLQWLNVYQGTDLLYEDYAIGKLSEDYTFTISYSLPEAIQTKTELEDSTIKLLDKGLITKRDAIKSIHGVDDDKANEMISEIQMDKRILAPIIVNEKQDMQLEQ